MPEPVLKALYGTEIRVGDLVHVASPFPGLPMPDDDDRPAVWTVAEIDMHPALGRARIEPINPGHQPEFEWYPEYDRQWKTGAVLFPAASVIGDPHGNWWRLVAQYAMRPGVEFSTYAAWERSESTVCRSNTSGIVTHTAPAHSESKVLDQMYRWGHVVSFTYYMTGGTN